MRSCKKILFILLCILSSLPVFTLREAGSGGRTKPGEHELRGVILVTAWYRDTVIQVAVANTGETARALKIATGIRDRRDRLLASQDLLLPPRSIKLVYFPFHKAPPGERRPPDHIMVFDGASPGPVDSVPIQNLDGARSPSLENFLVTPGDAVQLRYRIDPANSLRLFFLPRRIQVRDASLAAVEPGEGCLKPIDRGALKTINLPADYQPKIVQMMEGNHCFVVRPGERAKITLRYRVPEIKDCAVVRISDTRYEFQPDGGVRYGAGAGSVFMVYDPKTMKLIPLLELSGEEEVSATGKSTGTK